MQFGIQPVLGMARIGVRTGKGQADPNLTPFHQQWRLNLHRDEIEGWMTRRAHTHRLTAEYKPAVQDAAPQIQVLINPGQVTGLHWLSVIPFQVQPQHAEVEPMGIPFQPRANRVLYGIQRPGGRLDTKPCLRPGLRVWHEPVLGIEIRPLEIGSRLTFRWQLGVPSPLRHCSERDGRIE